MRDSFSAQVFLQSLPYTLHCRSGCIFYIIEVPRLHPTPLPQPLGNGGGGEVVVNGKEGVVSGRGVGGKGEWWEGGRGGRG